MKVTFFSGTASTSTVEAPQIIAVGLADAEKAQLLSEINEQATALIDEAATTAAVSVAPAAADAIRAQVAADADRAEAAAEMTTATAASLGSVAALSPYMMATVRQMDGTLPARPPAPFVFWQGWSNPGVEGANLMAPGDIWCRENAPTVPVSPNPADWSVYTLRDEPGIIIRRKPFPSQRPPLTGFEVSLDGGPSQIFTETEHRITGLTVGQAYVVVGFLRNYLGQGLPSEPEEVTVQSGPFMDDFTRPNQPLAQSPFWVDLRIGPSGSRRVQVVNNRVTLASTNDFLAARAGAYLNPRQYAQAKVLNSSTNTSEPRGVHLLLRTPEFVDAIISLNPPDGYSFNVTDYNWEIRENTAGASRVLASGGNPTVWPAVVRFEADGNALRGFINGVLVGSASDDKHPRGFAGLALNASGSEGATSVELDDFECGNLI